MADIFSPAQPKAQERNWTPLCRNLLSGRPLAGRSRGTDVSCENFSLFPFPTLAEFVILRLTRPVFNLSALRSVHHGDQSVPIVQALRSVPDGITPVRSSRSKQPALSPIEGFNRFAPFKPYGGAKFKGSIVQNNLEASS
jgi:hypothetical protein